ncbi:hypothetical protein [Pseudomonas sp. M30-35]|uniref:hypothetical protein n=1 Tax=Pseudomonas sp. M30-35 TaxID=1981174 RepID=UPI0012FD3590|nr:hypothetical protein [Pseudomonas sp. M30-35]
MITNPALETLQRNARLLIMPLFAAAVYSSYGLLTSSELPLDKTLLYWPAYISMFVLQVLFVSGVVQLCDFATFYLSAYIKTIRACVGLCCLTVGFIPLSGIGEGDVGNLLWPVAFITFGFHVFSD